MSACRFHIGHSICDSTRQSTTSIGSEPGPVALPVFKIGCSPLTRGGSVRLRGASATACTAPPSTPTRLPRSNPITRRSTQKSRNPQRKPVCSAVSALSVGLGLRVDAFQDGQHPGSITEIVEHHVCTGCTQV